MRHPRDADELFEVPGDELLAIVGDDPRPSLWVLLLGGLENNLDIGLPHRLAQIPETSIGRGLGPVTVFALAIAPQNPGTVYAGTSAGVYKSTDAGASWSAAKTRLAGDTNGRVVIPALAIDPQHPDTVYAADTYTGLLKSTDAGASWTAVNSGRGQQLLPGNTQQ